MDRSVLKENRIHGSTMFPLAVYTTVCNSGNQILDCHWHNEWEFLLVTDGKATFQIETSFYEVNTGQAIFIRGGSIHAGYPVNSSGCTYQAIVFDPVILNSNSFDALQFKFIEPLLNKQYTLPEFFTDNCDWEKTVIFHLLSILDACNNLVCTYELVTKANLLLILSEIIKSNNLVLTDRRQYANNHKSDQIKKVLHYIHTNYNKKIAIKNLCEQLNMSEGHFCRFFKQMMRWTPIEYINYYRINTAAQQLKETDQKILEIALDVGFDNLSYFHSIFKKHMNCTPLEYRNPKHNE